MRINLIAPPHPDASTDRMDVPLGLLYIAASLEKAGHSVEVTDLTGGVPWDIEWADIYGITVYAPTIGVARKIATKCRTINPDCKIVAGGAHVTHLPESVSFADSVVVGEGELAMVDLAEDYPDIKKRYMRPLGENLDLYPAPAYHLVDIHSYGRMIGGQETVAMLASRGCLYKCAFCAISLKTIKRHSPEFVADQMRYIKSAYGINKFHFQDDSFTSNKAYLQRVLDLICPLGVGFKCLSRTNVDTDDLVKLKKAGCDLICFGVESGSQKMLDRMNKNTTVEQNFTAIQVAKAAGLRTRAFFVIGFPGETKETIEETKRFIEVAEPDEYFISNFVPYPGTDVWNNPEKYGITWMEKDFDQYYQISKTERGGATISTDVLSVSDFIELENDFRFWVKEKYNGEVFFNRLLQGA